ncbi:MAG TPA: 2-phosphosulfolactate phosphatase [Hanamia sp.]|nr:2-phosphosulfolactate phosphatase [Hanamia sp.]
MRSGKKEIPSLNTVLSPSLLNLYDISDSTVVIIDVLRATSTIAAALYNGAKSVIPVDSVAGCIKLGKQMEVITAGERDGKIAEGLQYGNTPLQYSADFIKGKTLVLTTTNGTKLLHVALAANANAIITGSFCNISSVCDYLVKKKSNVMLACAAWKNRVNIEDTLFAGAVVNRIKQHFDINCDATIIAESLYLQANGDLLNFMKEKNASHYHRLMNYGLLEDIKFCLTEDNANVLSLYSGGRLIAG